MTWEFEPIAPTTAKEMEECLEPRGIRARLNRLCWTNPLVHAVFRHADAVGLSGEDKYTMLAFEALRRLEIHEKSVIEEAMCKVAPSATGGFKERA